MKKSVLTLLAIAVLSVASFSSCSNDGGSNDPIPTPTPPPTTTSTTSVKSTITADVLQLFDVQVVRSTDKSTLTYDFNNAVMVNGTIPGMASDTDSFVYDKPTGAKISTTLTVKPNWQDIVKARGDKPFMLQGFTTFTMNNDTSFGSDRVLVVEPEDITQASLEELASYLKSHMDINL